MKPIYFLGDNGWFVSTLVVTSIWKSIGWSSIVYLAAIAGTNSELYEAGSLDGCNRFQLARYITIPAIMPIVTIMFILLLAASLQTISIRFSTSILQLYIKLAMCLVPTHIDMELKGWIIVLQRQWGCLPILYL